MSYDIIKMGYFQTLADAQANLDKILERETFVVLDEYSLYTKLGNKLYITNTITGLSNIIDIDLYQKIADDALETGAKTIPTSINELRNEIITNKGKITTNTSGVATNKSGIATNKNNLDDLTVEVRDKHTNTVLYDGSLTGNGEIVLSETLKNFEFLAFELSQNTTPINIAWGYIPCEFIRYNNTDTTENRTNDYTLLFNGGNINGLYFRNDNKTLYINGSRTEVRKIVGMHRIANN